MYENIPTEMYTEIHRRMPIVCVDCVVSYEDKILLIKRKREPMKDHWWFPGGRLTRDERIHNAVSRIVKGETGVEVCRPVCLGYDETVFDADPFGHGEGTHTVNFVYVASLSHISMMKVVLDENHLDHQTFTPQEIYESNFHPYVKKFTAMAEGVIKSKCNHLISGS